MSWIGYSDLFWRKNGNNGKEGKSGQLKSKGNWDYLLVEKGKILWQNKGKRNEFTSSFDKLDNKKESVC